MYDSFHYGIAEARQHQEVLLQANPRSTLQWEFTGDYGTVRVSKDAAGKEILQPTSRFWLHKHFANLTPPRADALATTSDHPKVLLTAFAAGPVSKRVHTLHLLNTGAAREVTIRGIPSEVQELQVIQTGEVDAYRLLPSAAPVHGAIKLKMPARTLLTLTTMPLRQ